MTISKSTEGLIDVQFKLLEQVQESKELDLNQRIKNTSSLVAGIRQVAALDLANKKFIAKAPEFARDVTPLQLVNEPKEA